MDEHREGDKDFTEECRDAVRPFLMLSSDAMADVGQVTLSYFESIQMISSANIPCIAV